MSWRRGLTFSLVMAIGLLASGCFEDQMGTPSPTASVAPYWKTYIDNALADPELTDFERQVLSDYQVTEAEYAEARARYKTCMADRGWVVTDEKGDQYELVPAPGSGNEERTPSDANSACMRGSTWHIEAIFIGLRDNPQGTTHAQDVRACYLAHDVPDGADLSDDQFEKMIFADGYHASTPEGKRCFLDPMDLLGLTIEEAEQLDAGADTITRTQEPYPSEGG